MRRLFLVLLVYVLLPITTSAQTPSTCGVVDTIEYPIDGLVEGYDDFGLYRARFGGNHVGLDIGFDRWGEPVQAAARGRVTYSDPEGWDTEKGVVIVEHTFPDGSIAYTLYGHMEESDIMRFPAVGECVTHNSTLGGIGWPSRGRPHLHYEIRNFMPNDGGPGYVTNNPLDEGWYHPLDFTELWSLKLSPAFIGSTTFKHVPVLPPVMLDSGMYVLASDNIVEGGSLVDGEPRWRVETDGVVTGLAGLSDGRVVAHTRNGQVVTLQNGRYVALWKVEGIDEPFITLDEALVFAMPGGGLEAHSPQGDLLWTVPAVSSVDRVTHFTTNGQQIAVGVRADSSGVVWRLVDSSGDITFETTFNQQPVIAPAWDGSWVGLDGTQFKRFAGGENHSYGTISAVPGRTAAAAVDVLGNSYVYTAGATDLLIGLGPEGNLRWQTEYPTPQETLPPLMDTGSGCLLYTLDLNGTLNVFSTASGELVNQVTIYAGGERTSSPRARMLDVDQNEQVRVSSGFLSLITLDGWQLGGSAMNECLLG